MSNNFAPTGYVQYRFSNEKKRKRKIETTSFDDNIEMSFVYLRI